MPRKVIVNEFVTLDGVMQAPGGSDEDVEGGFEHGGWQGDYFDDMMGAAVDEWYGDAPGGMILGRVTYDLFASYWPNATGEAAEYADMMNKPPKYVASRTLKEPLEWENSTLLEGDVADAVRKLKEEDGGDLQVVGSSQVVHALAEAGLVDEYRAMIHPILIADGKTMFPNPAEMLKLKLADARSYDSGVALLIYEAA